MSDHNPADSGAGNVAGGEHAVPTRPRSGSRRELFGTVVRAHRTGASDVISRWSQAFANVQSRMTVFVDTSRIAAVSSALSPPKNRRSLARAFRGSWRASASSARQTGTSAPVQLAFDERHLLMHRLLVARAPGPQERRSRHHDARASCGRDRRSGTGTAVRLDRRWLPAAAAVEPRGASAPD